ARGNYVRGGGGGFGRERESERFGDAGVVRGSGDEFAGDGGGRAGAVVAMEFAGFDGGGRECLPERVEAERDTGFGSVVCGYVGDWRGAGELRGAGGERERSGEGGAGADGVSGFAGGAV